MNRRVENYISNLEHKARVSSRVADHLVSIVGNFTAIYHHEARMLLATTLVIHLWSSEPRYSHDADGYNGYIEGLGQEYFFRSLIARDQYFRDLPFDTQEWLVVCYDALGQYLRPPSVPAGGEKGEGMWLQKLIARVCVFQWPNANIKAYILIEGWHGNCPRDA